MESNANATWNGNLKEGNGIMKLGGLPEELPFTFASRFESSQAGKTNPEELIGGALAGCFSMFLSAVSTDAGFPPASIRTTAQVVLGEGPAVEAIRLTTNAAIPNISTEKFEELVQNSKENCPISKALSGVPEIAVDATLES